MTKEKTELLQQFLDAMIAGDATALGELLAEDATWHTPPSTMEGFKGPHKGRAAVIALLVAVATNVYEPGSTQAIVHHLIVDDAMAAAHFRVTGRLGAGASYDNAYAYIFRFAGSKIVEVWEHVDTAQFYRLLEAQTAA